MFLLLLASSTKYVKQVVFINHNWISPTLQQKWGIGVLFILKKKEEVFILLKTWRGW